MLSEALWGDREDYEGLLHISKVEVNIYYRDRSMFPVELNVVHEFLFGIFRSVLGKTKKTS